MLTGFALHVVFGLILAIVGLLLLNGSLESRVLSAAVFVFVVGSVLPDVDSPLSIPRKIFTTLLLLALMAVAILALVQYSKEAVGACENVFGVNSFSCGVAVPLFALPVPIILVHFIEKKIPGHRGPMHSVLAAAAYGVLCFIFSGFSFAVGTAGFLGYAAHLLLDFAGSKL